jgi:hypothetical protein
LIGTRAGASALRSAGTYLGVVVEIDTRTFVLLLVLPAVILLAITAGFMLFVRRIAAPVVGDQTEFVSDEPPERPWWGRPLVWVALSAVLLILGLFVLPQFLPGVFIFLPFMWIGGGRRREGRRPRRSAPPRPR